MKPELITGGTHVDERGIVSFVNGFNFKGVDRFYSIKNHETGCPRGWMGHKKEQKWFTALAGSILIAVVAPDDWEIPSRNLNVDKFVLSALKPSVLHVPAEYATAIVMLSEDGHLGVFSSGKIQDASNDSWRFDINTWEI